MSDFESYLNNRTRRIAWSETVRYRVLNEPQLARISLEQHYHYEKYHVRHYRPLDDPELDVYGDDSVFLGEVPGYARKKLLDNYAQRYMDAEKQRKEEIALLGSRALYDRLKDSERVNRKLEQQRAKEGRPVRHRRRKPIKSVEELYLPDPGRPSARDVTTAAGTTRPSRDGGITKVYMKKVEDELDSEPQRSSRYTAATTRAASNYSSASTARPTSSSYSRRATEAVSLDEVEQDGAESDEVPRIASASRPRLDFESIAARRSSTGTGEPTSAGRRSSMALLQEIGVHEPTKTTIVDMFPEESEGQDAEPPADRDGHPGDDARSDSSSSSSSGFDEDDKPPKSNTKVVSLFPEDDDEPEADSPAATPTPVAKEKKYAPEPTPEPAAAAPSVAVAVEAKSAPEPLAATSALEITPQPEGRSTEPAPLNPTPALTPVAPADIDQIAAHRGGASIVISPTASVAAVGAALDASTPEPALQVNVDVSASEVKVTAEISAAPAEEQPAATN